MYITTKIITILCSIILAIVLLYNSITHIILWYNLWSDPDRKPRSLFDYVVLLKSFIAECLFTLLKIILHPIYFMPPIRSKPAKKTSTSIGTCAILFVHGYVHHQLAWLLFIYKLKKQIKNPISLFTLNLHPPLASISSMDKLIKNTVTQIHQTTNPAEIILIGHSMGGLLSSYYTEYLA